MKIIDKNGKLFGKLNLVDFLIILLVIFFAVALFQKTAKNVETNKQVCEIEYTLLVAEIRDGSVEALLKGNELVGSEKGDKMGTIIDVKTTPAEKLVEMADGSYSLSVYENKKDAYVTVVSKGRVSGLATYLESGKKLLYGDTIKISNGYCETSGIVEKISVKDN